MGGSHEAENIESLEYLCRASATSGFEDPLISYLAARMREYADEVEIDRLGNVVGWLRAGDPEAQTVMLVAHMDEVGFVVRKVHDDGLLRLWRVGGIPEKVMSGQVVAVCPEEGERLPGIIGGRSHHVTPAEGKYVVDKIEDAFVDLGMRSGAEVHAAGIQVGTPVTWWPFFHITHGRVMSKALDNRLALYVLLETLRRLAGSERAVNVAVVATVHEEWSAWASITSAATVQPDMAIVLDVAIASDMPGMDVLTKTRLESGPVISTYIFHPRGPHMGTVPNPKLRKRLIRTAEDAGIGYQLGTFYGGMTDSSYMQYSEGGIPVADVGIPVRYTHYPVEIGALADAAAAGELIQRFVLGLPSYLDLSRGV